MAKRRFHRPNELDDKIGKVKSWIQENLGFILSEAEKRVGQRFGDMFVKAAVAIVLALIPSTITQGMSMALVTDIVTRVIKSSIR